MPSLPAEPVPAIRSTGERSPGLRDVGEPGSPQFVPRRTRVGTDSLGFNGAFPLETGERSPDDRLAGARRGASRIPCPRAGRVFREPAHAATGRPVRCRLLRQPERMAAERPVHRPSLRQTEQATTRRPADRRTGRRSPGRRPRDLAHRGRMSHDKGATDRPWHAKPTILGGRGGASTTTRSAQRPLPISRR